MNWSNKTIRNTFGIAFLTLLVIFPCFAAGSDKPKQVVFVHYNLKDKSKSDSAIIKAFKKTMAERGYTEGENIEYIDFVTRSSERDSAEEILNVTEKYMSTADMFITNSWTSLYVRSRLAKSTVPQLFAPALKSTALNMLLSVETEPGTNLSGIYLMFPPEKILRLTRHIFPKLRKYAYVYDSRLPTDIIFKAAYGQLNEHERYGITVYYLDLANGTDTVLQQMSKMEIEAFGGIVGVLKTLPELSRSKLPIITSLLFDRPQKSLEKSIEQSNIVAGLYTPFDDCGQQAAEMTADIFENKTTIEKTIPRPGQQLVFVNLQAANRLHINVPFSALEAADIVIK